MQKYIIITTIYPPTKSVKAFAHKKDYHLIVVGDKKTPSAWSNPNTEFISAREQERLHSEWVRFLPWNHYSRKMVGYLSAIEQGADIIIDTDDDNIPCAQWGFPDFEGTFSTIPEKGGFFNVYYFTEQKIWPRGFPLQRINNKNSVFGDCFSKTMVSIGVWQALANGDPDVDAIYRLTDNTPCLFEDKNPIVLGCETVCPFNSQNTACRKELFPLLYLPAYVTFRFTDILRGLVAQPIMWAAGYHLGFTSPTVFQERNFHDYLKDFESEIPCYLYAERVVELCCEATKTNVSVADNLYNSYEMLLKHGVVVEHEINLLEVWLKRLQLLDRINEA
jgi:hypothetical protein